MKLVCSLVLCLLFRFSFSLKIEVWNESVIVKTYLDQYSSWSDRSIGIPDEGLRGLLRYPVPRNACSSVEQVVNNTWIAFVSDYQACPGDNDEYLQAADYLMLLAPFPSDTLGLYPKSFLPQALVEKSFGQYLEDNLLAVNDSSFYLLVTDDFPTLFADLFLILGIILMIAIIASVMVFCCSVGGQWLYQKWKHRGLSQWQVRRLPKRRYNACKDSCESCSICLEEFKEGDIVRVLPCEHVFHPDCVDEWLHKWKRTCPLCKKAISRRNQPALAAETHPLLAEEQENYGSTGSEIGRAILSNDHQQRDSPQTEPVAESS